MTWQTITTVTSCNRMATIPHTTMSSTARVVASSAASGIASAITAPLSTVAAATLPSRSSSSSRNGVTFV